MVVSLVPFDVECATVHLDVACASSAVGHGGCYGCRASSRAASHGDTAASFPHPGSDFTGRQHLCEFDVAAFGKALVVFENLAKAGDVDIVDVLHEGDEMRIAHGDECSFERTEGGFQHTVAFRHILLVVLKLRFQHVDRHAFHRGAVFAQVEV